MPPRIVVVTIVAFWAMMTCVLIQREIVPRWRAGSAPAFAIEVTDEAGSPQVEWLVYHQDKHVGRGMTQIRRLPDRTFEMSQRFRFDDFEIPILFARLHIFKLDSVYHVTREGRLLDLSIAGAATLKDAGKFGSVELVAELSGEVKDGGMEPQFKAFGQPVELGLGRIAMDNHGSILNPMHLLHRLPHLQDGQRWKVPLLDPLKMFSAKEIFGQKIPLFASAPTFLEAEVTLEEMNWNRETVPCYRVSYREPAKDEIARTWVRKADGLVLAQEAKQHGYDLSIRRVP